MRAKTRKRDPGAIIVWFRLDLRLTDNPALSCDASRGAPVIPVFIWAPDEEGPWEATKQVLKDARVTLGVTYPRPIVDHADARARALQAFGLMRGK